MDKTGRGPAPGGPPLGEGESGQPAPALRGRLRGEREAETEDPVHAGDWSSPGAFSAPARYLPLLPPASPMSSSWVPKASCRACGRCVVSSARRLCMGREEGVIEHCVLSHREPGPVTLGLCLRRRPVVHRGAIHRVGGAGCGARSVFLGRLPCHSGCRDGAVLASPPARGTFLMAHRQKRSAQRHSLGCEGRCASHLSAALSLALLSSVKR